MQLIKASSTVRPLLFLLVSAADHVTPKTGALPGITVTISKNGGVFAAPSGALSEIGNGWYKVAANAANYDTLGALVIHAESSGADPVDVQYQIVSFDPEDAAALGLSSITTIAGYTDTLESGVASLATAVAAVQTSANTIAGYTDTLEASAATVAGYTDTLEASATSIAGTLAGLVAAVHTAVFGDLRMRVMSQLFSGRFRFVTVDLTHINLEIGSETDTDFTDLLATLALTVDGDGFVVQQVPA